MITIRDPRVTSSAADPGARERRRRAIGLAIHGAATLALIPAFLWFAPRSDPDQPLLLGVLLAIMILAGLADVLLTTRARFDATLPVALLAMAAAGPLPGFLMLMAPSLVGRVVRRRALLVPGNLADLAAFGWAMIAASAVLALSSDTGLTAHTAPALFTASFVAWCVNYAIGPGVGAPLYLGKPALEVARHFQSLLGALLLMSALTVAVAALVPVLGVGAFALFAAMVLVPGSVLTLAVRHRPVSALDEIAATRVYAEAIADVLQLDRAERALIARAAARLGRPTWERLALRRSEHGGPPDHEVGYIAFHAGEHWDGSGEPAGLRGTLTPRPSRVLAVARGWSALTARGTAELTHAEAMLALAARSGTHYDPDIVAAAATVVEQERTFLRHPSFEPRVHTWPGSHHLRRTVAPRFLARAIAD